MLTINIPALLALALATLTGTALMVVAHLYFRPELHGGRPRLKENQARIGGMLIFLGTVLALEFGRSFSNDWMVNFWLLSLDMAVILAFEGGAVIVLWRRFGSPMEQKSLTEPRVPSQDVQAALADVQRIAKEILAKQKEITR